MHHCRTCTSQRRTLSFLVSPWLPQAKCGLWSLEGCGLCKQTGGSRKTLCSLGTEELFWVPWHTAPDRPGLCMRTQMGDYNASSFYRFAKRGHRFKCWECGVKKKAPCGEVDRPDLPWCCHRRLGAYLPLLTASKTGTTPDTIALQSTLHLSL